jgi:response regulator RpfG family c-di-GMP phosphodiesterase
VDPYPDWSATLADALRSHGHEVRTAYTEDEALELVEADPPDIVICEARFPRSDGFSLVQKIGELVPERITFVMVTGYADLRDRAKLAGFDHFFAKPADAKELARLVGKIDHYCPDLA